jgi:predicted PurR-regulated permease PerM
VAADASVAQKVARSILIGSLVLLGAWMLRRFLPALCWAVVLGIATSSLYDRWLAHFHGRRRHLWAALTFTTIVGLVLIVPLAYGGVVAAREGLALARSIAESGRDGTPDLPQWIVQLPFVGDWLRSLWEDRVTHAGGASMAVEQARPAVFEWTRVVGAQLLRRVVTLAFTLLTLFFVYLHGEELRAEVPRASRRLFGEPVERLLTRAVDAIRATVDGVVLVAVAEGAIMSGVYAVAGVHHPILFGVLTGIFAMVPFAAPVAFGVVALLLASAGAVGAAVGVLIAGSIVLFIADHFVRPAIIGGGARLPFLWVLLGILGGIESFGLVGIFLGPALMAALVSLWRGWVATTRTQEN